jgi:cytochrome P450 family 135
MATLDTNAAATAEALPPGPTTSRVVQTFRYTVTRSKFYADLQRRYGDTFTMRITGNRNVVAVTRPEHIREVFTGPSDVFHAGGANKILRSVVGENSLLLLDGDEHLRARKQLMPGFNGAALRDYGDMMTELVVAEVSRWPIGTTFPVQHRLAAVTLEVILKTVFGVTDKERLNDLRTIIAKISDVGVIDFLGWAYPKLERYWPWKRNRENLLEFNRLIYAEIAERREASDLADRGDVLSRLLCSDETEMSDVELRDHMITLLIAGHDTTSSALAWTFHELARRPGVLRAAQEAADRGDDEYLLGVHKEVMRLLPAVPNVGRRLQRPAEVAGYRLPAGTIVAPIISEVHRNPDAYEDPDEFRPERYIGKNPASATWIPFGGGVHRCIGAGFSLQESAIVLGEALRRYDIGVKQKAPERPTSRHVTQIPANGSQIVVTPRQRRKDR